MPTRDSHQGRVDNRIIDHLAILLQAGLEAGAWRIEDANSTAVFLFSGLHGVVDHAYAKEKRVNRGRLTRRLERLCFQVVERAAG